MQGNVLYTVHPSPGFTIHYIVPHAKIDYTERLSTYFTSTAGSDRASKYYGFSYLYGFFSSNTVIRN